MPNVEIRPKNGFSDGFSDALRNGLSSNNGKSVQIYFRYFMHRKVVNFYLIVVNRFNFFPVILRVKSR
jgi:hypothetical protein